MTSIPDFTLETTFDYKFTTRAFGSGVPTTLAGTPVIDVYEDNSLTQITGAETLTVDFDGITGYNNLRIVATTANGFEAGKSYSAVLSAGTVAGTSVIGETVMNFSIERSPAFLRLGAPAGVSVSADLAVVESQTDDIGVAGAGLTAINLPNQIMDIIGDITGNLSGSVGSVVGHTPQTGDSFALADGASGFVATKAAVDALQDISVADILTTALTESYAANGAAPTLTQFLYALHQMLMQFGIVGTSLTVRKLDDATAAFVVTLDSATAPTDAKRV